MARTRIQGDVRGRLKKSAATRVLHDVHQEPASAGGGTVLIVDIAVDVPLISGRDELSVFVLLALAPVVDRHRLGRRTLGKSLRLRKIDLEKIAGMNFEIAPIRQSDSRAMPQHHQLRLD